MELKRLKNRIKWAFFALKVLKGTTRFCLKSCSHKCGFVVYNIDESNWKEAVRREYERMKERIFHLEDLELLVQVYQARETGKYLHDYPIFSAEPMYTGTGRPCVNAWQEACGNIQPVEGITVKSMDCGCCSYYRTEQERDLIGVCMCEKNRILQKQ